MGRNKNLKAQKIVHSSHWRGNQMRDLDVICLLSVIISFMSTAYCLFRGLTPSPCSQYAVLSAKESLYQKSEWHRVYWKFLRCGVRYQILHANQMFSQLKYISIWLFENKFYFQIDSGAELTNKPYISWVHFCFYLCQCCPDQNWCDRFECDGWEPIWDDQYNIRFQKFVLNA